MSKRLEIRFRVEPDGAWQTLTGRDAWALAELHRAGLRGVTPIDTPGPRWSAYVHNLRSIGLIIETIHESHGGRFPGSHARYVLRSDVSIVEGGARGEAA
jgi:hypothetical protein